MTEDAKAVAIRQPIVTADLSKVTGRQFNRLLKDREQERLVNLLKEAAGGAKSILSDLIKTFGDNDVARTLFLSVLVLILRNLRIVTAAEAGVLWAVVTTGGVISWINPFD